MRLALPRMVSVLKQLHDDLDAAVFEAYGWSDLRAHAPALRACGAAEAASRLPAKAGTLTESARVPPSGGSSSGLQPRTATILTRLVTLNAARAAEESATGPVTPAALATRFKRAKADRIAELLETLVIVGHARKLPDGRYTASALAG